MIFNSFVTQIGMLALSLGIIFIYAQPTFAKLDSLQEAILQYQAESSKVSEVTSDLNTLVTKVNGIEASDLKALLIYIPDEVDHVAVSRDLLTISEKADTYLESVDYDGLLKSSVSEEEARGKVEITGHVFKVNLTGTYEQTKLFLSMLEQNKYPLEVHELKISSSENGLMSSDMTIITYSHI